MKIVINVCYGGFSLSPLAVKRLAELNGKECFFYESDYGKPYKLVEVDFNENGLFAPTAFSVGDEKELNCILDFDWKSATKEQKEKYNEKYNSIYLDSRPENRTDSLLIQVVEELGDKANGGCAKLKVIEIPDGTDYYIDEYDGNESVNESHRSWS